MVPQDHGGVVAQAMVALLPVGEDAVPALLRAAEQFNLAIATYNAGDPQAGLSLLRDLAEAMPRFRPEVVADALEKMTAPRR